MKPALLARHLRQYWRGILTVTLLFTLLGVSVLAPLVGLLVQALISLSGAAAVADQDIALLLLSPLGLAGGILLVSIVLAITALELGALQAIAQAAHHGVTISALEATQFSLRRALPLLRLTTGLTVRVLLYLSPFLLAVGAVAWYLLSEHDINYYLTQRPAEFRCAVAITAALVLLLVWLLGRRLLGWSLVLPLLLFAGVRPEATFRESERLTGGHRRKVLRALFSWLVVAGALLLAPILFLDLTTGWLIARPQAALALLLLQLGAVALIWSVLNFLVGALNLGSFALVVANLYEHLGPPVSAELVAAALQAQAERITIHWSAARVLLAFLAVTGLSLLAGALLLRSVQLDDRVEVVAHRGAAGAAPENTIASVRRAIEDGADWIEVDVQETRDGQVVVVHDSDFMKLASNPLKVWEGNLATIQQIDVGSWFGAAYRGEKVPTLEAVLAEIRGRAGLVIELKYYGHDERLEPRVVQLVEEAGMAGDVVFMSLKLDGIRKLQQLRPNWTAGLLAAKAVGDLTRLEVDFLAVNTGMASHGLIRRAHAAGKRIFVWTVNDAISLSRWMSMGVDGVITDEPALARRVLEERAKLGSVERLLLSAALFFGKPEVLSRYRRATP